MQYTIPKKLKKYKQVTCMTKETPKAPKYPQIMLWSSVGNVRPGMYMFAALIRLILTG